MRNFEGEASREFYEEPTPAPPTVELFAHPERASEFWPETISKNPEFIKQLLERKEFNERLDAVIERLPRPDISLEEAVADGFLTEKSVAELYESLSATLSDADYGRLALYLPFEFLPSAEAAPKSEELQKATEKFVDSYMTAWKKLLTVHDVRANFVDGNILDFSSRTEDLPRVVKAAHLIPKLMEKGLLTADDIFLLYKKAEDENLKQSIADTLPVLADMKLLTTDDAEQLRMSSDPILNEAYRAIHTAPENNRVIEFDKSVPLTPDTIDERLAHEFKTVDAEEYGNVTEKRKTWLRQNAKRIISESISAALAKTVETNLGSIDIEKFLSDTASEQAEIILADGLRLAIEEAAAMDTETAEKLYAKYQQTFYDLWNRNLPNLRETLEKTFFRLHGLEIVSDEELTALDLSLPSFAGPFSKNMEAMKGELSNVSEMIAHIEKDPTLSASLYPAALVFGSRLKGYGGKKADVDIAVLVKPGTDPQTADAIREILAKTAAYEKAHGEIVEFWLEETDKGLTVRDSGVPGEYIGGSSWVHTLFGSAWEGDPQTIKKLREELLAPYLLGDDEKTYDGKKARAVFLEELERDTLQYRLMHKGYEKFNPDFGGINTPHTDSIDGKSKFWDSGYRQTATKLFANRVFLPQIKK